MMLSHYCRLVLRDLSVSGSLSTLSNYSSTFQSVCGFHGGDIPLFTLFTRDCLVRYQSYLLSRGVRRNTIAFYMRVLRALYYRAVRDKLVLHTPSLFTCVYTTDEATVKRSLTVEVVRRIAGADLSAFTHLIFSRDMFLLSLYLQGMPFVDLAHLRKSDLKNGHILQYRRQKTHVEIIVGIDERALALLNKYKDVNPSSPYLLPILKNVKDASSEHRCYQNALRNYNRHLHRIGLLLEIDTPLSSYVCRHTWATLAHHLGVGIHVISQALGHRKEETTHIYLKLLDSDVFTAANRAVIDLVFGSKQLKHPRKTRYGNMPYSLSEAL